LGATSQRAAGGRGAYWPTAPS